MRACEALTRLELSGVSPATRVRRQAPRQVSRAFGGESSPMWPSRDVRAGVPTTGCLEFERGNWPRVSRRQAVACANW